MPPELRYVRYREPQRPIYDSRSRRRGYHMDATAVVTAALTIDMDNFIKRALGDLSDADLAKQPAAHCNSIGWTLWHATRVEDGIIATISSKPQVWIEGGWHQKFGMPAEAGQNGVGDSL